MDLGVIIVAYRLNLVAVDFTTKHFVFDFIIMVNSVVIIVAHHKSLVIMDLKKKTTFFKEITVTMNLIFVMKYSKITVVQSFTTKINSTNLHRLNFATIIRKTNYYLYSIAMIKFTSFLLEHSTVKIKITISTEFAI